MKDTDFNNINTRYRVLVAPLEWGLGHATRCIPIIKELIANGCEVLIAAEKATGSLLQHEFPQVEMISLPPYNITYSRTKRLLPLVMLFQLPKIIWAIYKEHQWLKKAVKKYKINAVISDNRFGLYHSSVKCVYITHQLVIKTGNSFTEKIAQKIHYLVIRKYNDCWIPDYQTVPNMGGELSHPGNLPVNVQYIGCLSRFEKFQNFEKKYDLLAIISGPEPQRSIFEQLLITQTKTYTGKVLLVRGKPEETGGIQKRGNISIENHLNAMQLNGAILQSEYVVSRSGYTTVMDMVKLQKRAILIPTPGQTEQEYLADHLMKQNMFCCVDQENFTLPEMLEKARRFNFNHPAYNMEQYKETIRLFVQSL